MICYLPFIRIAPDLCGLVAQTLGPVIVYTPLAATVPEPMRVMQRQGLLDVRIPSGFDENRILNSLQGLKSWAQLHDGHIGDMIHYLNMNPERSPFVDETSPSQIRTQIRHYYDDAQGDAPDPVCQAALFLELAQEYDQHQQGLSQELGTVMEMERDMYADMGSDTGSIAGKQVPDTGVGPISYEQDPGGFLTDRRLQAWARIVLHDARPSWLYLTTSAAVFDHLKGLWSEVIEFPVWHLSSQAENLALNEKRRIAIQALSRAQNFKAQRLDPKLCGQPAPEGLSLSMAGLPGALTDQLLPEQSGVDRMPAAHAGVSEPWHHTLIGLVV